MKVNVVRLYDQVNPLEKFGYERMRNRRTVADLIYNVRKG